MKKTLRLKYRLEPVGDTRIEFQVLYMDESFRNQQAFPWCYTKMQCDSFSNKNYLIGVRSWHSPSIILETHLGVHDHPEQKYIIVYLWGYDMDRVIKNNEGKVIGKMKGSDNKISSIEVKDKKQQQELISIIHKALKQWSVEWFKK
jgi:hypothetical protein